MSTEIKEIEKEFLEYVKKMSAYNEALGLIFWDLRTGAPKNGIEQRSEVIGLLSSEVFEMSTSKDMAAYIAKLSAHKSDLPEMVLKVLEECQKEYDRNKKYLQMNIRNMSYFNPKPKVHGKAQKKMMTLIPSSHTLKSWWKSTRSLLAIGVTKAINIIRCSICMSRVLL